MNNPVLSIIIPMYNCAPVIERCLERIDYEEAEIIVIDDGSEDNGASIVEKFMMTHPNVRLIRKENGGVSSARNLGIETAMGQYIMFLDADDYLASGGIASLLNLAIENSADVLKYRVASIFGPPFEKKDVSLWTIQYKQYEGKAEALNHTDISDYHVVDALFKKSILIENNIRFKQDMFLREDDVYMCEVFCNSKKVIGTDIPLYCYVRGSSCSQTMKRGTSRIVESELKAVKYRKEALSRFAPHMVFPIEKAKHEKYALGAQLLMIKSHEFNFKKYIKVLREFKTEGCWPINNKHIALCYGYMNLKLYFKVLLCNCPILAFLLMRAYKS